MKNIENIMKPPKTKICTKCGKRKKLGLFYKYSAENLTRKTIPFLKSWCKACNDKSNKNPKDQESRKAYYYAHKKELLAKQKAYNDVHAKEIAVYRKAYNQIHKEEIAIYGKAKSKAYYHTHKKEAAAKAKAYRQTHKEEMYAKHKIWRQTNKEKIKKRAKVYYIGWIQTHKEEIETYKKAYAKKMVNQLTDPYVKKSLRERYGLSANDITAEMIQIQREFMAINRLLKKKESV